jgi:hypothetical protein
VILLATQAMTTRLLPVNSSAPPTTTSTSPRENANPASIRPGPNPKELPVRASVENMAPNAMNAPASTPSARVGTAGRVAFLTPICSTSSATWAGG